ncbi:hypothetical protein [Butyrivibrio sp. VCB2001]|jgi:hypothetical protein|uniref:hypothetical protein n=1 Tax=Butyrivibrio sp. VCB2001 TaxID=1280667 RepID=UPI00047B967B|nr:hypothetical protein [Butyrivibrio sp. VCB2001]
MSGKIKHSVERTAFEKAVNFGIDKGEQNECQGYAEIVNAIEQVLKDVWQPMADLLWEKSYSPASKG